MDESLVNNLIIIITILVPTLSCFGWIVRHTDSKFDKLELKFDAKFDKVDAELIKINEKINTIDIKINSIDMKNKFSERLFEVFCSSFKISHIERTDP